MIEPASKDSRLILLPYGDGADCNGSSSRVLFPDQIQTHRFICSAIGDAPLYDLLNNKELDALVDEVAFDRFVAFENSWYYEKPPFDKVLAFYQEEEIFLDFDKINFELKAIQNV